MTKKDFILIAKTIRELPEEVSAAPGLFLVVTGGRQAVAEAFADALATTNIRFDRDKFITACGGTP